MSSLQEQLAHLRERIARVDEKWKQRPAAPPSPPPYYPFNEPKPEQYYPQEYLSGQEVTTAFGQHFETEKLYERHRRHGSMDISALADLPEDLLAAISNGGVRSCSPTRWAFLDTETTGLAGGTGTYAFLVGVGRIAPEGFYVRQFFMREHGEEASLLAALNDHLAEFDVLVTYNGRVYDQPLLETRYQLRRSRPPFGRLDHMDLLYGARRLWKMRVDSCRLVNLENQILGVEREGDLPGAMIPYVYFDYLRTREAFRVVPILHHNSMDILSLACLTGVVPWAFREPYDAPALQGPDLMGVARWLQGLGRFEHALAVYRKATERELKDDLLFRCGWEIALLEKRLGREEAALPFLHELTTCRNVHRLAAFEELAKYFEHKAKDHERALDVARRALELGECPEWRRREARLERRVTRRGKRLL